MTAERYVLCSGDAAALAPFGLGSLATLLARALAEHLGDWAVVHELGSKAVVYRPGVSPTTLGVVSSKAGALAADVRNAIGTPPTSVRAIQYLIVDPFDPVKLAEYVSDLSTPGFDVVTPVLRFADRATSLPAVTAAATPWLKALVGTTMPAILLPDSTQGNAGLFEVFMIPPGWSMPDPPERDACRLRFTPPEVNAALAATAWSGIPAAVRRGMERWARTVSWRRVGFVVSGGGASVFRLRQFFEFLETEGVPVDVLGGVSGGTLFSACHAVGGLTKIDEFAASGPRFTACTAGALVTSWVVEHFVDQFLGGCGVNNTEIRVLPLSTRLAPMSEPQACVVVEGTFGQAVRASGGAPFFGPYFHHDARQLDGGLMAVLPPPLLAERFGADVVFAANVMALPAHRFPGEGVPYLGTALGVLYRYTPLGRAADLWNSEATMIHSLARAYGDQADHLVDTPANDWGLFEPFEFYRADEFAAKIGPDDAAAAIRCRQLWEALP